MQKDYAEEFARLAATAFTLGFADLTGWDGCSASARRNPRVRHKPLIEVETGPSNGA